jgi:hypothetical protein
MLRKTFRLKGEEDGSWRKLHSELHSLYSSLNIVRMIKSRRMRWAGHEVLMGEGRGVYRVLVGRPEGKRPLGRPGHSWEDNIKMDPREAGIDEANWIQLAQDRVHGTFGFHKEGRLLSDKLSNSLIFKDYPAPWS